MPGFDDLFNLADEAMDTLEGAIGERAEGDGIIKPALAEVGDRMAALVLEISRSPIIRSIQNPPLAIVKLIGEAKEWERQRKS